MFAQSMGDYGALASIAARAESLAYSVRAWLGGLSPTAWLVIAAVVIGLFVMTRR